MGERVPVDVVVVDHHQGARGARPRGRVAERLGELWRRGEVVADADHHGLAAHGDQDDAALRMEAQQVREHLEDLRGSARTEPRTVVGGGFGGAVGGGDRVSGRQWKAHGQTVRRPAAGCRTWAAICG